MAVAPLRIEALLLTAPLVALALAGPQLGPRQTAFASTGVVVLAVELAWRRALRIRCRRPRRAAELRASLLPPGLAAGGAALLGAAGAWVPGSYGDAFSIGAIMSVGVAALFLVPGLPTPLGRLIADLRRGNTLPADAAPTVAELAGPPRPHLRDAVPVDAAASPEDVRQLLTFTPAAHVTVGGLVVGTVTDDMLDPPGRSAVEPLPSSPSVGTGRR